jgi:AcrR family transcriptional regulator
LKRVVKKSEVRKQEILAASQNLFDKQGYEGTSVEDIIREVSLSKGAFYHHFKGKHAVLLALVDQIGSEMVEHFSSVVNSGGLTAVEKLKLLLRGEEKTRQVEQPIMEIIHQPKNRELQERLNIYAIEHIAPLLAKVIKQGNEEGVFHAKTPLESMQLLLASSQFVFDSGLFDWSLEKKTHLLTALQSLFESAVGAKPGTLGFVGIYTHYS